MGHEKAAEGSKLQVLGSEVPEVVEVSKVREVLEVSVQAGWGTRFCPISSKAGSESSKIPQTGKLKGIRFWVPGFGRDFLEELGVRN